jgi:hypothetical protein
MLADFIDGSGKLALGSKSLKMLGVARSLPYSARRVFEGETRRSERMLGVEV